MDIIDRISYSKEVKMIKANNLDWKCVLGVKGLIVRNIVSDADKLEAIGKIGLDRCIEYTKTKYFEKHSEKIPKNVLKVMVNNYADEKLKTLKDHFIRTKI